MTEFSDLGLAPDLLRALAEEGYTTPTPIQAAAVPVVNAGRDLLGIAQTGTGKTAAFALPILNRLVADRRPAPRRGARVLVLSPTRELATQIAESFRAYGRHLGVTVAVVFGGVGHRPQISALRNGVDVLVATPGRLLDHIGERDCDLSRTEVFVLDEADQMLDLGFVKPIRRIVAELPKKRQSLFFSATMPDEIAGLAADLLHDPERVAVTPVASTVERIRQKVIHVERTKKRALLAELLADTGMSRTLVFTRTKRGADRVALYLVGAAGIQAAAIHGNKSQSQREHALRQFRDGQVGVLVATDIAARGIDIDAVSHVVNFELPEVPEAYVHRIGRTARAGASGSAISLCDGEERHLLRAIERLTRQTIPAEDRRNDSGLAVDRTRAGSDGVKAPRPAAEARQHGRRDDRRTAPRQASPRRDGESEARRDDSGAPRRGHRDRDGAASRQAHGHRPSGGSQRERAPRQHAPGHRHDAHKSDRRGEPREHDAGAAPGRDRSFERNGRDSHRAAEAHRSDDRGHRRHGAGAAPKPMRDGRAAFGRSEGERGRHPAARSAGRNGEQHRHKEHAQGRHTPPAADSAGRVRERSPHDRPDRGRSHEPGSKAPSRHGGRPRNKARPAHHRRPEAV